MKKSMCQRALVVATVVVVGTAMPLRAAETNDRVEASILKTYVYIPKDDAMKTEAKENVVTLNHKAASEAQKELNVKFVTDEKKEMVAVKTPEMPKQTEDKKIDEQSITASVKTPRSSHRPAAPTGLRLMSPP
jgi:hypothetical protein